MTHQECQDLLFPLLEGELSGKKLQSLHDHLASCQDCQKALSEATQLQRILSTTPLPEMKRYDPRRAVEIAQKGFQVTKVAVAAPPTPEIFPGSFRAWARPALALAMLLLALAVWYLLWKPFPPGEPSLSAKVTSLEGMMLARGGTNDLDGRQLWREVAMGASLSQGSLLRLWPGGNGELTFPDGSIVRLSGGTTVTLSSLKRHEALSTRELSSGLKGAPLTITSHPQAAGGASGDKVLVGESDSYEMALSEGRIWVDHKKSRFVAKTPNARIVPLGTLFSVAYLQGRTGVNVFDGTVTVIGPERKEVRVKARHTTRVTQQSLLPPAPFAIAQIHPWELENWKSALITMKKLEPERHPEKILEELQKAMGETPEKRLERLREAIGKQRKVPEELMEQLKELKGKPAEDERTRELRRRQERERKEREEQTRHLRKALEKQKQDEEEQTKSLKKVLEKQKQDEEEQARLLKRSQEAQQMERERANQQIQERERLRSAEEQHGRDLQREGSGPKGPEKKQKR